MEIGVAALSMVKILTAFLSSIAGAECPRADFTKDLDG